jgi:AcrR family transcriptional regulator
MSEAHEKADECERRRTRCDQLLTAAAELFRRHGFHGASMAELAKTASMSVGQIYHYFENKEAIVAAIVERDLQHKLAIFEGFEASGKDLYDVMIEQVDRGYDDSRQVAKSALMLEIQAEAARNPKVARLVDESDRIAYDKLRDLVLKSRRGKRQWPQEELEARTEMLVSVFQGLRLRALRRPDDSRNAMINVLRMVIRRILED